MALQLNFNQMYFFYMVAKHAGVRSAAKALHVSPPAVSAQLKRLEENIGTPLTLREGGRLVLSQYGKKIFPEVERLFEQADYLERFMARVYDERESEIYVGAHYVHLQSITPKVMPYYALQEHGFSVQFLAAEQNVLIQKLLDNEVSVAFLEHKVEESELQCIELFQSRTRVVMCEHNPLAKQNIVHLQDLTDMHILLPRYDSGFAQCLEQYFIAKNFSPLHTDRFTIPIIKGLLRNSPCISFFPGYMVDEGQDMQRITAIEVVDDLPEMQLYVAYSKKNASDIKVKKVREFLKQKGFIVQTS